MRGLYLIYSMMGKLFNDMQWPPDYTQEIKRRIERLQKLREKPSLWPMLREHYKTNPVDWINHWCVTYDPRNKPPLPRVMPFILFPKQEQFIWFLYGLWQDRESGLCEKCRDMGATWECCAFSVWLWLFHSGSAIGWGSNKAESVDDKENPKAIFPKMRQIIQHLPGFMIPDGFNMLKHGTHMKLINPENGSTIIGESGDNIGRGGRTTMYFKDEAAHYERPELIEAALGDNTDVQVDISSVNGSANVFYRRRMAGELWERGKGFLKGIIRVFIFDWRDHPNKTQEWHDARRSKAEREGLLHIFNQEVERDYTGSVDKIILQGEWLRACIDAHIKLGFPSDGEKVAGQDVADGGGDKNAIAGRHGVVLKLCEHWGGDAGEAAPIAVSYCVQHGFDELYYDSIGVGAGFKAGINNITLPRNLRVQPWNAATSPLDADDNIIPGDSDSPTNNDQYANLKAQSYFRMRGRVYKTYRAVVHGETYPYEEMISFDSTMPHLHELLMQLTQPVYKYSSNGKTMVDKKPDGALSPNMADAVVICYNPTREISILDVL